MKMNEEEMCCVINASNLSGAPQAITISYLLLTIPTPDDDIPMVDRPDVYIEQCDEARCITL